MPSRVLTEIWIYPIKSLAGIRLPKASVLGKGLHYDRRWMLVDNQGRFLTQREHPDMALFAVSMNADTFTIKSRHKNSSGSSIEVPFKSKIHSGIWMDVHIWDDVVKAEEVDSKFSNWFSDCLGLSCKLVFFPESNTRPVDTRYAKHDEQVSLADAFPFLIIGESSLDDLNKRLGQSVGMKRFRPNFVFSGGVAFEEDAWNDFRIGAISFHGAKPCARCVLTTIDPETGIKGAEPLKTLASYRRVDAKVMFGQNVLAMEEGTVAEGDPIEIIDLKLN